jgi:hypothetical protein
MKENINYNDLMIEIETNAGINEMLEEDILRNMILKQNKQSVRILNIPYAERLILLTDRGHNDK